MNPLGLLIVALGILLVIVGVKGSQHNLAAALTHRPSTTAGTSAGTGNPGSGAITGTPV